MNCPEIDIIRTFERNASSQSSPSKGLYLESFEISRANDGTCQPPSECKS